jgi:hypothetical protein
MNINQFTKLYTIWIKVIEIEKEFAINEDCEMDEFISIEEVIIKGTDVLSFNHLSPSNNKGEEFLID